MNMRMPLVMLCLGWSLLPGLAFSQAIYNLEHPVSAAQAALPSQGPAAARINPAELSEVHLASVAYGSWGSSSGKSGYDFFQAAVGTADYLDIPIGIAAGIGYMRTGATIDGSNSSFIESEYAPGIAIRYPVDPGSAWRIEAGLAWTIGEYNAFNAVKSQSNGISVGTAVSVEGRAGRFGAGFAYHDLKSPRMRLPEDNGGEFRIPGWREYSLDWSSVHRLFHVRMGLFDQEDLDPSEGPINGGFGLSGWEMELRPIYFFALKAERTKIGSMSNLGMVFYTPGRITYWDFRLELNFGHSMLAPLLPGSQRDEGLGWLIGAALSVEI